MTENKVKIIGIDMAKYSFHLFAVDNLGNKILSKKLTRKKLIDFMSNHEKVIVAMEACIGTNYFARKFRDFGHEVRIIPAQYVKPYVKTNKNDEVDAEAICEAATRPNMRFVSVKEKWQHDIINITKSRGRLLKNRTALCNEARGFLAEYGITVAKGIYNIKKKLCKYVQPDSEILDDSSKIIFKEMYDELLFINSKIAICDQQLSEIAREKDQVLNLTTIPGVGLITAVSFVANIGNGSQFKNGRELSSWLGLVPKQYSTGGKQKLSGISKRGNKDLRTLLIHCARSLSANMKLTNSKFLANSSYLSKWYQNLKNTKHNNVALIAMANKLARIIWAVSSRKEIYQARVC